MFTSGWQTNRQQDKVQRMMPMKIFHRKLATRYNVYLKLKTSDKECSLQTRISLFDGA